MTTPYQLKCIQQEQTNAAAAEARQVKSELAAAKRAEERARADRRRLAREAKIRKNAIDRVRFAVLIQGHWRGWAVRHHFALERERREYLTLLLATLQIQNCFRHYMQRKAQDERYWLEERRAIWASWVLQTVCKCVLPQAEARRRGFEATKRRRDVLERQAGIHIQASWRGFLERRKAGWLRSRLQAAGTTEVAHYRRRQQEQTAVVAVEAHVVAATMLPSAVEEGRRTATALGMSRQWAEVWTETGWTESAGDRSRRLAAAAAAARAQIAAASSRDR